MNLSGLLLKMAGWRVSVAVPPMPKCVICVAPHTSNWDFIVGRLAWSSIGRKAKFLMKSTWFFFPMGLLMRVLGGVPVYRKGAHGSLVEQMVAKFASSKYLNLAITPEGTRSRNSNWRSGFLQIAAAAHVPVCLALIDFDTRTVTLDRCITISGNSKQEIDDALKAVKQYYRETGVKGRHPENFSTDDV